MAHAKKIELEVVRMVPETVIETVGITLELSNEEAFDLKMLLGKTSAGWKTMEHIFDALGRVGIDPESEMSLQYKLVDGRNGSPVNSMHLEKKDV